MCKSKLEQLELESNSIYNLDAFVVDLLEHIICYRLKLQIDYLKKKYNPDGFNIGVNNGEDAGQTVFHAHIHVIPRYKGDVPNPRGGVRNIIPGKGDY